MQGEHQRDPIAERVVRNEARFRDSNERILAASESFGVAPDELLPFLCECADVRCTTILQLTLHEYEQVRRNPVHFVNARGHETTARGWVRVIDEFDRYTIVEKIGDAGELAAQLDPRKERSDERA